MKFSLVAIGSRFEYQDQIYTKTTPLVAVAAQTGTQKLIPRSANVRLIETGQTESSLPPAVSLSATAVCEAFELAMRAVEQDMREELDTAGLNEVMTRARRLFFEKLDMTPD